MDILHNESVQRVQQALFELGHPNKVIHLPDSARTAQMAANVIGCEVAQIAKSIIFRLKGSDQPLLVVASGINRVNENRMGEIIQDKLGKADADYVRERTGFVIGGVAPLGHVEPILTFIDEDLFQYTTLWAAAGHPKTVFELTPEQLVAMTQGQVSPIK